MSLVTINFKTTDLLRFQNENKRSDILSESQYSLITYLISFILTGNNSQNISANVVQSVPKMQEILLCNSIYCVTLHAKLPSTVTK